MAALRPRPLLLQRDFASLFGGQLISIFGDRLAYFALGGLLLEHTRNFGDPTQSSVLLGIRGTVMLAPVLLFAPFAGPWVDRWNLKRTLIISDAIRALLVLLIPFSYSATHHVGVVFGMVFLLFTCNVFFLPAKSAMTPEIVPPEGLLAANTLLSMAGILATGAGALAGGWITDHWGWSVALWVNAVTYAVSVLSLAAIRYHVKPHEGVMAVSPGGYLREIGEGFSVVRHTPAVGLALTALAAIWVGGGFIDVAGNQHIQRNASVPGMERPAFLLAALAVGSAIATWWVNTGGKRVPRPVLLGAGLLLTGVWIVAFAMTHHFALFLGASFLIGLCIAPVFVLTETLLQEGTDLRQRGRVFSLRDFAMRLGLQLALIVAAFLTPILGTAATLMLAGGLVSLSGALSLVWGRRQPDLMRTPPPRPPNPI